MKYEPGTRVLILPSKYAAQPADHCTGTVTGGRGEFLDIDIPGLGEVNVFAGLVISLHEHYFYKNAINHPRLPSQR